jgi:hypothetical protein
MATDINQTKTAQADSAPAMRLEFARLERERNALKLGVFVVVLVVSAMAFILLAKFNR